MSEEYTQQNQTETHRVTPKNPERKYLPTNAQREIAKLYKERAGTAIEIAKMYGISDSYVYRILDRYGVSRRYPKLSLSVSAAKQRASQEKKRQKAKQEVIVKKPIAEQIEFDFEPSVVITPFYPPAPTPAPTLAPAPVQPPPPPAAPKRKRTVKPKQKKSWVRKLWDGMFGKK